MTYFDNLILYYVFLRIVERFTLIRGCRYNWSHHIKTLVHLYVDFFIFVLLNSYSHASKLPRLIKNGIRALGLKISGRTKYHKAYKMKIKGISTQGEVDCSLIKMCWMIDSMEFDPRWRLLKYVSNS